MLNLNIKINGLSDKISLKIVEELQYIIEKYSYLDLRRFENIIITSNFERDIEKLSSNNNQTFKNRYRANQDTYAIVLTVPKNDDFELILIIKADFATTVLNNHQNQAYKDALHIIHHELAHVHDNNKKIDAFKQIMQNDSYKGIDAIIYPIAQECWSEYIANYISSNSALETDFPKQMAKNLVSKINSASNSIKTQLMAYKINPTREDLLITSISEIKSLLKTASYLQGYLHGFNINLQELDYDADYTLECSYFKDIYEAMQYEFYSIKELYPHGFINLSIYKNLSFYIEGFFNQMGIVFVEEEKKVVVKIM